MNEIKIIDNSDNKILTRCKVYVIGLDIYYHIFQDCDTESLRVYSLDDKLIKNLIVPFGTYAYGLHTITGVLIHDIYLRTNQGVEIEDTPWED